MKKILLIHLGGGLGDLLLSTVFLKQLKRNYADCFTSILMRSEYREIVEGHPYLDEIIPAGRGSIEAEFPLWVKRIKERKFDMCIIPWSTARIAWLGRLACIPVRVGQDSRLLYSFLYTHRVSVRTEKGDTQSHWVDILLDYIRILGCKIEDPEVEIRVEAEVQSRIDCIMDKMCGGEPCIGFHVGKGLPLNPSIWPVEAFARIADRISSQFDARVLLTGDKNEVELVAAVISHMQTAPLDFSGKTSLKELAALIGRCRAFVCPDSAPMHIAAAMKVPTLGIFALKSDFPNRWGPYGTAHEIVRPASVSCSKICIKEKCRRFNCYEEVSCDEIVEALGKLLKRHDERG